MMKKIAALAGSAALLLASSGMALATYQWDWGGSDELTVKNYGTAEQSTVSTANSNTGYNTYQATAGGWWWGGSVDQSGGDTGNAGSLSQALSSANTFETKINASCGCYDDLTVKNFGSAYQQTVSTANANTGYNLYQATVKSGSVDQSSGDTGDASTASDAESWANMFTTKIGSWGF